MKKLLLGAMMAALFVSGDAEAFGKKANTLAAATKAAQNALPDTLIVNKYMPEGYNTDLDYIRAILEGQLKIINKNNSVRSVLNFKDLLTQMKTLIENIQLVGKRSTKKPGLINKLVKRTPTIASIQTRAVNVATSLDTFIEMEQEGIDSFMETSHAKNNIQSITDSLIKIRGALVELGNRLYNNVSLNQNVSQNNQGGFLLKEFSQKFQEFVISWRKAVERHGRTVYVTPENSLTRTQPMYNSNIRARNNWNNVINRVVPRNRVAQAPDAQAPISATPATIPAAPPQPVYDDVSGTFMSQQKYDEVLQQRGERRANAPAQPVNTPRRANASALFTRAMQERRASMGYTD